jgi:polysaccharide export outer membrane protein
MQHAVAGVTRGARALLWVCLIVLAGCGIPVNTDSPRYNDGIVERVAVTGATPPGADGPYCGPSQALRGGKGDHLVRARGNKIKVYRVGPGDDLRFNIFGEEGMRDFTARVDAEGHVQLPIVETVHVAGKSTQQIQAQLKSAYSQEFVSPWVTVELAKAESHPLYFLGEFRNPGVKYLEFSTELIEALAMAEGLEEDAYLPGARLIRGVNVCTVDLQALLKTGDFSQNVWMQSGDILFAPNREDMRIYMLGAVTSPQGLPFGPDGRTILQALSDVGGPENGAAKLQEVRVIRTLSPTRGELILLDVQGMLSGQKLDFPLQPGDVVYVPRTTLGNWNTAIAQILPSLQVIGGILTPITLIDSLSKS